MIKNYHCVQNRFQRSLFCRWAGTKWAARDRLEAELTFSVGVILSVGCKSHTKTQQLHKHSRPQRDLHTGASAGFDPGAVIDFLCVCDWSIVRYNSEVFSALVYFFILTFTFTRLVRWILNVCSSWQTHILIHFLHFSRVSGFWKVIKNKTNHFMLILSDLKSDFIPGRFVRLRVRLIPFDFAAAHPGNFEVVLLTSSRVVRLIRIIQDRVGIQTYRLEVFRSRVPREEARLTPESSLEECGFRGGPEETPPEDTVYYDYTLLFTDCPVLNCDHYFRSTSWDSADFRSSQWP